jgi:hypothetical protein
MTNISNIYDAIQTEVALIFPTKTELSDPRLIENNDMVSLSNGYGIDFGPAINTNRQLGCFYSIRREITITVTRQFLGGHKSNTIYDTTNKNILEDLHLLIKLFEKNEIIANEISNYKFLSDGGIERVFGENKNFVMIRAIFQIEYTEDTN